MNSTARFQEMTVPIIGAIILFINVLIPSSLAAYIATALFAVAAFARPKQSILFLLIYFPLRSFLVEVNPALKLIGDVVILFAFLRVVWDARTNIKSIFRFEIYEWAFIGFLAVGSVSALLTDVTIGAIVFQLRAFVITFLLLYIVKRLDITKRDIKNFLILTVIVAVVLVIQGLVEKLSMRSALMPEKWINRQLSANNKTRIYGLINNPSVLAVYLTIAAVLTCYLKTLLAKTTKIQWLLNIVLVFIAGTWILTYSRGTWIAFVIGLVVYFLFTRNWKFVVKAGVVVGLGFVLIAVPITYGTQWISSHTEVGNFERTGPAEEPSGFASETDRIKGTFTAETLDKSKTTGRLFIVNKGFEVFKDYPVIGAGFSTFGDSASKSYASPIYADYGIDYNIYADNQYIVVIAETGAVGVILFAVFLLGMLVMLWNKRKQSPYAIPMLAALIGIYWCGFIYNIWEDKSFTLYFYILLGALVALADKKGGVKPQ